MERSGIKQQFIMSHSEPEAKIFACSKSVYLAEKIAKDYGIPLGKITTSNYSDGEFQTLVRGIHQRITRFYCLFYFSKCR